MKKVKYELDEDDKIITQCPYGKKDQYGRLLFVNGDYCRVCNSFIAGNTKKHIIVCEYEEKQENKNYMPMVIKKEWKEFRNSGLLLIINQILHIFGWAIVFDFESYDKKTNDGKIKIVYPARVKYRGFDEQSTSEAYRKISKYMVKNSNDLLNEIIEEKQKENINYCYVCNGAGKIYENNSEPEICPSCNGSGRIKECPTCSGSGTCPQCEEYGWLPVKKGSD